MDPKEIFPMEVWEAIFERVKDPQDWVNLYRASPTFEGTMAEKRTLALLPQVFPLVFKRLQFRLVTGVLPLRLVSRKWKGAVDKTLEESPISHDSIMIGGCEGNYRFSNKNLPGISSFLERFDAHPGNPFVGRSVSLIHSILSTDEKLTEFTALASRLLAKFGSHIREMRITDTTGVGNTLDRVKDCVQLTQNLERLNVEITNRPTSGTIDNQQTQLAPVISNLKALTFRGNMNRDRDFLKAMLTSIVRVVCHPDSLKKVVIYNVGPPSELTTTFPNLESARVETYDGQDYVNLRLSVWPLKQLELFPKSPGVSWALVAWIAEHFKETLTLLRVYCDWPQNNDDPEPEYRCELPHLESLIVPHGLPFHSFMSTHMPSLETLCIIIPVPNVPEGYTFGDMGPIKGYLDAVEREMSEFNIWRELPKLREVQVSTGFGDLRGFATSKIFYREMYGGSPHFGSHQ